MSPIRLKMVYYTLGIFLFSCGIQPSVKNIAPEASVNFLVVGIIGTIVSLSLGYFLNFIQRQFFDKKHVVNPYVLDSEDTIDARLSDNQLWPFKLGIIFSGIAMAWLFMFTSGLYN